MGISKFSFRIFVLASMVVGVFAGFVDLMFGSLIPRELEEAFQKMEENTDYSETEFVFLAGMTVLTLVVGITSTIGLLIFKPWAPRLSILVTILSYLLPILTGPVGMSGVAVSLNAISSNMWGAVVAITFFSPLAKEFRRLDS